MSYFLKSGATFKVATKESMDLHERLPAGNYTVKYDKMGGFFYLEAIEGFEIRGKIYGDTKRVATRILNTFGDRTASTGVMLTGEKGSGKTLLAKMLSTQAREQDIPTIVINAPWCGDEFNAFLQMIEQPTVILFDEFEKVYDRDDQEKMLTLLDGVYPSKKLFVITCNDKWRVNEHMRNRPGRIFYMLDYKGLDQDFIIEYCEDNLKNKTHIQNVVKIAMMFDQFNFDMLKALVEEMNRYDETPQEAMKMLNAKPEFAGETRYKVILQPKGLEADFILEYCEDNLEAKEHIEKIIGIAGTFGQFNFDMLKALVEEMNRFGETPQEAMQMLNAKPEYSEESRYKVKLLVNGEEMAETNFEEKEWQGNPLNKRVHINFKAYEKDEETGELEWDWDSMVFEPANLKKIDDNGNKYVFVASDGATLVLTKVKEQGYRYWDAF